VTIVLITHQMQVIKQIADRVAVIDGGRIVEMGRVLDVFTQPQHATTRSLIDEILPASLPDGVLAQARRVAAGLPAGEQARLLRVSYSGPAADAAIWSELATAWGVRAHVLHGVVDEIQGQPFGMLAVLLCGSAAGLQGAQGRLNELGYAWTEVRETAGGATPAAHETTSGATPAGEHAHV
jgi:D-methionine transport system ATP-binding protein